MYIFNQTYGDQEFFVKKEINENEKQKLEYLGRLKKMQNEEKKANASQPPIYSPGFVSSSEKSSSPEK